MLRTKMRITIEGPTGGAKRRLLDFIRDAGYTVEEDPQKEGSLILKATVIAPYGEVTR